MLKLSKTSIINEDMIEGILIYGSSPVQEAVKAAREGDTFQRACSGREPVKSVVKMTDGFIYACPRETTTYMKYVSGTFLKTPSKCFIRSDLIREVVLVPDGEALPRAYRNRIARAKQEGKFLNLCKTKKAKAYIILTNGTVYSTTGFAEYSADSRQGKEEQNET